MLYVALYVCCMWLGVGVVCGSVCVLQVVWCRCCMWFGVCVADGLVCVLYVTRCVCVTGGLV